MYSQRVRKVVSEVDVISSHASELVQVGVEQRDTAFCPFLRLIQTMLG